jgi:CRISPR-associated protein Cas2
MYVIVVYDTASKNCPKIHKILKRFLHWNQNSVFEGEITEGQFFDIRKLLEKEIAEESSVILYQLKEPKNVRKIILGREKGNTSNIV